MISHRDDHRSIQDHIEAVRRDGHTVLKRHFAPELVQSWRAAFTPLLEGHIARATEGQNRGPARHYVTLPFTSPFADPAVLEDDTIVAITAGLVGEDQVLCQLATDTPLLGSTHQELHRDAPPLFPEAGIETPPFQLAVNFALVPVTAENGPFETTRGTHMMPKAEAMRRIASGEIPIEPVLMDLGDVMIRDVRCIHRGTPNRTGEPRPMVVLGFSRRWLHRPEVSIRVPRDAIEGLSPRLRHLLRFNPVVDRLGGPEEAERYQAFAY